MSDRRSFINKGHELERELEEYFKSIGYLTQRNISLEGKSGGSHEVDVLAERLSDDIKIRILVECKAWNKPIEKETVTKVSYVLKDLGIDKAIIVSLNGWTIGAEKAAKELGIELWGREKIEKILGKLSLAKLETTGSSNVVLGFPLSVSTEDVKPVVEEESSGFFGFGREEIVWIKLVWLPCYMAQISYFKEEGLIVKKIKRGKVWATYEAITGSFVVSFTDEPDLKEIEAKNILPPRIKENKMNERVSKILKRAFKAVRYGEKDSEYYDVLETLGIPLHSQKVVIDKITLVFYPFYISLLKKNEKERVIAIDGVYNEIDKNIGTILTLHLGYVEKALEGGQKSSAGF